MTASRVAPWLVATVLLAGNAAAQSPSDRTLAETLFRDAKQLMDQGKFSEACPKLVESQRLDPGGGTLINLARCHEKEGKVASAWSEYEEALAVAKRDQNKARIKAAQDAIGALLPKLPKLTVTVDAGNAATINLDGAPLPRAALGSAMPLDPGSHVVGATMQGKKPWSAQVTLAVAEQKSVVVPTLEQDDPVATATITPTPAPAPSTAPPTPATVQAQAPMPGWMTTKRGIGLGAIGLGVVGFGVGAFLALRALSLRSQSDDGCAVRCTPGAVDLNDQAITSANLANIGFVVGVVGVAVGVALVLTGAPTKKMAFDERGVRFAF